MSAAANPTEPTSQVVPDLPADSLDKDRLNFGPYVQTLLDIILNPNIQTPLTIGIFGSWGSGKTSLMKMIEAGITAANAAANLPTDASNTTAPPPAVQATAANVPSPRQTFCIWFNAWLYSKEASLWRALVIQVISGLLEIEEIKDKARDKLDALAEQFYRVAGTMELGDLSIKASDLQDGAGTGNAQLQLTLQSGLDLLETVAQKPSDPAAAVKALRDQVRKTTAGFERERIESLEKFRKDFKDLLETYIYKRGCLVIFVDDLDRCLPEKAVEVLEAIKLFLDVPGCIFVLGIDHGVIERGIRLRYGEMGGASERQMIRLNVDQQLLAMEDGAARYRAFLQDLAKNNQENDTIDGARYLEKIIQIPFVLPPVSLDRMGQFVADLAPMLPDSRCAQVLVNGLELNPRQVKRALNIFTLLHKLSQNTGMADRVSPVRLAKLVVIQQQHPDLYQIVRQEPDKLELWERAFRRQQNWEEYQRLTRAAPEEEDQPLPDELVGYEDAESLEKLLTFIPLVGDVAREANFIGMTGEQLRDLVFLTRTVVAPTEQAQVKSSAEPPPSTEAKGKIKKPRVKPSTEPLPSGGEAEGKIKRSRGKRRDTAQQAISYQPITVEQSAPIPLHQIVRLSLSEIGFVTQQALRRAAKLAEMLQQSPEADPSALNEMAQAGEELLRQLRIADDPKNKQVMEALTQERRTVQVLFEGSDGPLMARLPWEMAFAYDGTSTSPQFTNFWGARHVIERWLVPDTTRPTTTWPPMPKAARELRVGLALDYALPSASDLLQEWQERKGVSVRETQDSYTFRQSCEQDPADIYIIYGRGVRSNSGSAIAIGKGDSLSAKDMAEWKTQKRVEWTQELLIELRQLLSLRFSEEELRTLCFEMNIDYDSLPGAGRDSKARELIGYFQRRDSLDALIEAGKRQRPDVPWDETIAKYQASSSKLPPLFYFVLESDPSQEMDWTGWPAALDKLGAGGIIAPLIYARGQWPLQLMRYFFARLLTGNPVGESLRNARVQLYEETRNPLGLLYVHSGPPDRRWAEPSSTS